MMPRRRSRGPQVTWKVNTPEPPPKPPKGKGYLAGPLHEPVYLSKNLQKFLRRKTDMRVNRMEKKHG